jgi:hypothetical protein
MVGTPRFELGTPCTPCKCATRLRHVPPEKPSTPSTGVRRGGAHDTQVRTGNLFLRFPGLNLVGSQPRGLSSWIGGGFTGAAGTALPARRR